MEEEQEQKVRKGKREDVEDGSRRRTTAKIEKLSEETQWQ
jgi:hypothetical protein